MIKLANGKEVSLEDFTSWSFIKQDRNINPVNIGYVHRQESIEKLKGVYMERVKAGNTCIVSGGKHILARRVMTPQGKYETVKIGAKAYDVCPQTLSKWIKMKKEGFFFIDPLRDRKPDQRKGGASGAKNGRSKSVITPEGQFPSIRAAALHYKLHEGTMAIRLRSENWPEFYYERIKS